jgi:hypothetical protein
MNKSNIINTINNFEDKYAILRLSKYTNGLYQSTKFKILKTNLLLKLFNELTSDLKLNENYVYDKTSIKLPKYVKVDKSKLYKTKIFNLFNVFISRLDDDSFNVVGFPEFLLDLESLYIEYKNTDIGTILSQLLVFVYPFVCQDIVKYNKNVKLELNSNVRLNVNVLLNELIKLHEEISSIEEVVVVNLFDEVYHSVNISNHLNRLLDNRELRYYTYK